MSRGKEKEVDCREAMSHVKKSLIEVDKLPEEEKAVAIKILIKMLEEAGL